MTSSSIRMPSARARRATDPDRLSAGATLAWTTTGVSGAVNVLVLGYWVFYGTDVLGLDPVLLGVLALLSKILEAVAVVLAGWLVDRSPETRWGKARPYELAIVGVWAATWMLFSVPDLGPVGQATWLFVCLFFVNVVFTSLLGANDVLYLSRSFNTRVQVAKVSTRTGFLTVLGAVVCNAVTPILVARAGTDTGAWSTTILFVAIPLGILGLGRFIFVKERFKPEPDDAPKVTFQDIREVLTMNRYIWIVSGVTLVGSLAGGTGIAVYYFKYIVGDIAVMSLFAVVPLLILPSMLLFPWLMKRTRVSTIITVGALCGVAGGLIMIVANGSLALVFVANILTGIGILPSTFLLQLLVIDSATYNQWAGRRRLEGTMGAITYFAQRLGAGLGAAVAGAALGIAGYDGTLARQSASADTAIVLLAGAFPAVLWLGVAISMRSYRQFENMLPTITQELAVITSRLNAPATTTAHADPKNTTIAETKDDRTDEHTS